MLETNKEKAFMLLKLMRKFALFALVVVGGCTSFGGGQENVSSGPNSEVVVQNESLDTLFEELETAPLMKVIQVSFPDGFGRNGVRVVRRYFSASGKQCTAVDSTSTGDRRIICRDDAGIVNTVEVPRLPGFR